MSLRQSMSEHGTALTLYVLVGRGSLVPFAESGALFPCVQ